jgi:hypothetical protein
MGTPIDLRNSSEYCRLSGVDFDQIAGSTDSRAAAGYECASCNEMLEIRIDQCPLA